MIGFRVWVSDMFATQRPSWTRRNPVRVRDRINNNKGVRELSIEVPLNFPGLEPRERRMLDDGISLISQAFIQAESRMARDETSKKRGRQ